MGGTTVSMIMLFIVVNNHSTITKQSIKLAASKTRFVFSWYARKASNRLAKQYRRQKDYVFVQLSVCYVAGTAVTPPFWEEYRTLTDRQR